MTLQELADWDASETALRIRRREVSGREVLVAALERAQAARHLGGIVTLRDDAPAVRSRTGSLSGVPTFIKDLAHQRGLPIAWGSRGAGHYVSRKSDAFVERFTRAGVVSLGKSATPELGLTATTEPLGRPPCRNPWAPAYSAGGSSGGAASLVAAGVVPIAHASDGGGSIRIPAACCGLVGLKPSRYRLDMAGSALLPINVATDGVLSRSVRDTVLFFQAMEPRRRSKKIEQLGDVALEPNRRLRIGLFVTSPLGLPVHPDNQEAARRAGRTCEALGHEVDEIDCPFDAIVISDFLKFWGFLAWIQKGTARLMLHRGFDASKVEPWTQDLAHLFSSQRRESVRALTRLRAFSRTYRRVLSRYDVLVNPTTAEPPPALGHLAPDLPFDVKYERIRRFVPFTPIQNIAGAPAISLPLGQSTEGLPIGVQFAARPGADRLLLELALSLEQATPWPTLAPPARWRPSGAAS